MTSANCYCCSEPMDGKVSDMRLGCGDTAHYHCLVKHIQDSIRDRDKLSLRGICCPCEEFCKVEDGTYSITLDDLDNIVDYRTPEKASVLDHLMKEIGVEPLTHELVSELRSLSPREEDPQSAASEVLKFRKTFSEEACKACAEKFADDSIGKKIFASAEKNDWKTLLQLAHCWFGHEVLNDWIGSDSDGSARGMPNATWTPLMIASVNGNLESVKILTGMPSIQVNKGHREYASTPLYYAAQTGRLDIVEFLCAIPDIQVDIVQHNEGAEDSTAYSDACTAYNGLDKDLVRTKIRAELARKGARAV